MSQLTPEKAAYIDDFTSFGVALGMPRSVARVLGFLLVSQPSEQSADSVQVATRLSSGAVNNALRTLHAVALVRRVHIPGDRHFYYEFEPDGWHRTLQHRLQMMAQAREIATAGLQVDADNQRLIGMRDFFAWCETEFADIMDRMPPLPSE
jgi:DNA-binding transcriptional regulator GbsR (MarR family)